jgi:hypothetical protein
MVGGDLHWIWSPYSIYQEVDYVSACRCRLLVLFRLRFAQVYGLKALQNGDGFTNAQGTSAPAFVHIYHTETILAFMNVVESLFNLCYLWAAHISNWAPAVLIGFAAAVMTLSKTVLYWMQEYYCNGCSVGHNSMEVLLVYWVIPNG